MTGATGVSPVLTPHQHVFGKPHGATLGTTEALAKCQWHHVEGVGLCRVQADGTYSAVSLADVVAFVRPNQYPWSAATASVNHGKQAALDGFVICHRHDVFRHAAPPCAGLPLPENVFSCICLSALCRRHLDSSSVSRGSRYLLGRAIGRSSLSRFRLLAVLVQSLLSCLVPQLTHSWINQ